MQYSPKLKKAMEEIKDILKKHDIAGAIALHTPGYAEFTYQIMPSYSCAKLTPMPDGAYVLSIKAKKFEIPDNETRHKLVQDTANMFVNLSECLSVLYGQNIEALERMKEHVIIEETGDSGFSTPIDQNN